MTSTLYDLWLAEKLSPATRNAKKLYEYFFHNAESIYNAQSTDYIRARVSSSLAEKLCSKDLSFAQRLSDYCEKNGIVPVSYSSELYPETLRSISDPPAVLFCKGDISLLKFKCLAMVGTRRATDAQLANAFEIAYKASSDVIATGLALGIDSACAHGVLEAGGKVIGVLGCGPDRVYPKENKFLFDKVIQNGLIISEFLPSSNFFPINFVKRNRIISSLSYAVLVLQSETDGGAMHTARYAHGQSKLLYTLPDCLCRDEIELLGGTVIGSCLKINENFASNPDCTLTNEQIMSIISCPVENTRTVKSNSVKEAQASAKAEEKDLSALTDIERKVYLKFTDDIMYSDALAGKEYSTGELLASLTILEMYGLIEQIPGGRYRKI